MGAVIVCPFCSAGINKNSAAEETEEQDWDATFAINTKGVFLCCQVCGHVVMSHTPWWGRGWGSGGHRDIGGCC